MIKIEKKLIFFITSIFNLILILTIIDVKNTQNESKNSNFCEFKEEYKHQCLGLFIDLNNPDQSKFYRPPLSKVPDDLLDEFTQHGEMPITNYFYFNDVYYDANTNATETIEIIKKDQVDYYRLNKDKNRNKNIYVDWENHRLMPKYSNYVKDKTMAVIGTQQPWLEAIALDTGAKKVVTLGIQLIYLLK
jgi:hypothetical protein